MRRLRNYISLRCASSAAGLRMKVLRVRCCPLHAKPSPSPAAPFLCHSPCSLIVETWPGQRTFVTLLQSQTSMFAFSFFWLVLELISWIWHILHCLYQDITLAWFIWLSKWVPFLPLPCYPSIVHLLFRTMVHLFSWLYLFSAPHD